MTKDIVISDEYWWNATFGLHAWVLTYLRDAVEEPAARRYLAEAVEHRFTLVCLETDFSHEGQRQVLEALTDERFLAQADAELHVRSPDEIRVPRLGYVRLLSLMAADVLRNGAAPSIPWDSPQAKPWPEADNAPDRRRTLVISDEYDWSAVGSPFAWVLEFLRDAVEDRQSKQHLAEAIDYQYASVDLRPLPEPGRTQALHALRTDLARALNARAAVHHVGHVTWLKLMAEDLLRSEST
jgi:hypothetical protein